MQIPWLASNFMIKLFKKCNQMLTDVLHSIRFWCLYFLIKLLYVRWKCRKYFCKLYPYHQHQHQPYTDTTDWLTTFNGFILFSYCFFNIFIISCDVVVMTKTQLSEMKNADLFILFYFYENFISSSKKNERVKCLWKMRWNGRISYNNHHQDNIRNILYVYPFFWDIFRKYLSFLYTHHNASSSVRLL